MLVTILVIVGVAVLILAALALTFVVGMRRKSPAVLDVVRAVNRRFFNPRQLRTAGTPGAYASVVCHVGRTSGTDYRTPIVAESTEDGFAIALPYGPRSNWVRNVLAAGEATIVHEGTEHRIARPRLVPMAEVEDLFPEKDRTSHRLFNVERALLVDRVA